MELKLLAICSSIEYPEGLKEMIISFNNTKEENMKLIVYLSKQDKFLEDYKKIFRELNFKDYFIGEPKYMIEVVNHFSSLYDAQYYQLIHDDHIYKKGWTDVFKDLNGKIAFFCHSDQNPTAEIIPKEVVRKLGYFIYPKFRQAYIEPFMKHLMSKVGSINCGDKIFHKCWHGGHSGKQLKRHEIIYGIDEEHGRSIIMEAIKDIDEKFK